VIYLNRLMPLEGGLYQWAKLGFNQTVGFMLAWNLWLYVIVFTSEIGLQCATILFICDRTGRGVDDQQQLVRGVVVGGDLSLMVSRPPSACRWASGCTTPVASS